MTPMPDGNPGWGSTRATARDHRRARRAMVTVAALLVVMAGAPLIAGLLGPSVPIAVQPLVMAIGLVAIVTTTVAIGWRQADEVQRQRAAHVFAAIGVVALVGNPVARMLGEAFHMPTPIEGLWWMSVAAGALVFMIERWVGGVSRS